MLKLKLQKFGHLMQRNDLFEKTLMLGKIEGRRRRGDRGWNSGMASQNWWTWVWASLGSWWCHPTVSSVVPFSSCPQSFPASGSFQMSQLSASTGQSIGVSASTSVPPMNTQDSSFRMDWLELLAVQGTLKSLHQHCSSKASVLRRSAFFTVQLAHPYMTTGKTIVLTNLCWQSNASAF